ncbi:MAG: mechanosensitive ion channel [Bryobacteraceae bacterium]|nr:mechanosensitive ion channel [Bryobacteraceae bacterium]
MGSRTKVFEFFTPVRLLEAGVILALTWLAIRYISGLLSLLADRTPKARFLVKWLEPVLRIGLWFGAIVICFRLVAPTTDTFLAAVGSLAIAIGLGAQDLIKNIIGGFVILADRPYQLGDRVKIGEAYGEIDHIGLRSTKLTTPDDTRVTIPNSDILGEHIFNANSGVPDCQVVTDVILPPGTDPGEAWRVGMEAAHTSPYTLLAKPVVVLIQDLFDQRPAMRVRIKAYVYDHRFEPAMQSDVTRRAKTECLRRGLLDQGWR